MSENGCGVVDLLGKVPGFEQMFGVFHSHVLTVSPCLSSSRDSRRRFVWLETLIAPSKRASSTKGPRKRNWDKRGFPEDEWNVH